MHVLSERSHESLLASVPAVESAVSEYVRRCRSDSGLLGAQVGAVRQSMVGTSQIRDRDHLRAEKHRRSVRGCGDLAPITLRAAKGADSVGCGPPI